MHILRHSLARFLIVALVGVWSHAAYQNCLAFAGHSSPDSVAGEAVSPPCPMDPGHDWLAPDEPSANHPCLGVCDCGLETIPVSSQTLYVSNAYKPTSADDVAFAPAPDQRIAFRAVAFHPVARFDQPAAACPHPLQKTCIQLK